MKHTFLYAILVFVIFQIEVNANTARQNVDSLSNIWQNPTQSFENRLKSVDILAGLKMRTNQDSANLLIQQYFDLAEKSKIAHYRVMSRSMYVSRFYANRETEKAQKLLEEGYEIAMESKIDSVIILGIKSYCEYFIYVQDYVKAYGLSNRLLEMAEKNNDLEAQYYALNKFTIIFSAINDKEKKREALKKMTEIVEKTDDLIKKMLTNLNLSYEYIKDNSQLSRQHLHYALTLLSSADAETLKQFGMYGFVGLIYWKLDVKDSAFLYFKRDLRQTLATENPYSIQNALIELSEKHASMGHRDSALFYLKQSMTYDKMFSSGVRMAYINLSYGSIYGDLEMPQKAVAYCLEGLRLAEKISSGAHEKWACKCLYENYKKLDNLRAALSFYERMNAIKDSLDNGEEKPEIQKIYFQNRLIQDSLLAVNEKTALEATYTADIAEKKNSRNISMGISMLVLLLAGGTYSRLRYVRKSKAALQKEKDRSDELLLNILPADVAEELKATGVSEARDFDDVTVLFTDFKDFTKTAEKLSAKQLVEELNYCFKAFDEIIATHGLEKIKTIGDAYMAAGGLHSPRTSEPKDLIRAALQMQDFMNMRRNERNAEALPAFEMRVGIHTGPVVAGIVGVKKFQYDIWGDTVNTASRMESMGEVGKVNISQATYELLKDDPQFSFESRGKVEVKGKGEMEMWFVQRTKSI